MLRRSRSSSRARSCGEMVRGGSAAGRRVGVAAVSVTVRTEAAKVAESTLFLKLAGIFYFHDKPCAISKPEACATGKADGAEKGARKRCSITFLTWIFLPGGAS